jgi:tetratricopeptide (TPR) repeat protein
LPIEDLISSKCKNNLALFKVKGKDFPAVKIAGDYNFKKGEDIFILGSPSELKTMIYNGVVKNVFNKDKLIQISIPVLPEKSGTPVFNMDGKAVAALTFLPKKGKDRQFAVPLKNIVKQLNKYKKLEKKLAKKAITSAPATSLKPLTGRDVEHHKKKEEVEKKPEDANEYFLRGCAYHELNMFQEAIKFYQKAVKIKPDFVEAFINLGVAYYKLGQYTEAIDAYKQAIRIKPNSLLIYNKLGAAYIINGKYSMARETFKKATDIAPGNAIAHFNLGIAYFLAGETDAAFKEYKILKDLDKKRADILFELIYN